MAFVQHRQTDTYLAASTIAEHVAVKLDTTEGQCVLAASSNVKPFGLTDTAASQGNAVTVIEQTSIAKAVCAASVGPGAIVGVASANGALGPVSGASGSTVWSIGESRTNAAAGETFSVYINPRQLSNLA
jgi:hypothetical protein